MSGADLIPVTTRAEFDPDFGKTGFARDLFRLRFRRLRIDQAAFATRFGLSFGAVKDNEQGRCQPSRALRVLVAAIDLDPALMARAARAADERWPQETPPAAAARPLFPVAVKRAGSR